MESNLSIKGKTQLIKNMTTLNSKVEDTTMDGREVRSKFSQEVANQLEEEQVEKLFA